MIAQWACFYYLSGLPQCTDISCLFVRAGWEGGYDVGGRGCYGVWGAGRVRCSVRFGMTGCIFAYEIKMLGY